MHLVHLRSLPILLCVAAIGAAGCGQGNTSLSPTALVSAPGTSALATNRTADPSGGATVLGHGHGNKDDDSGRGGDDERGSDSDDERGRDQRGNDEQLSGFVTAVGADSLTVRGTTVKLGATTVIRHGGRRLRMTDIQVGDHVKARGVMDGATLVASEVKVQDTGRDNDDDDEDEDRSEVEGLVSGLTGTCPALTFTVRTTRVTTTSATVFDDVTCAALANGAMVEVKGTRQADGSIAAGKVENWRRGEGEK